MPPSLPPTSGPVAVLMRSLMTERLTQSDAAAAMQQFFDACRRLTPDLRQRECDALIPIAESAAAGPACYLSVAIGGLIEQGVSPGGFPATLHRLLADLLPRAAHLVRQISATGSVDPAPAIDEALAAASQAHPLSREGWDQLDVVWPACVAAFCHDSSARRLAREFLPTLAHIAPVHEGGYWLMKLLSVLDEAPLVVLDPVWRVGIAAQVTGCVDNQQLHSLLLDQFPRRWYEWPRIRPAAMAVMSGVGPQSLPETIRGRWGLYRPSIVLPSGAIRWDEIDQPQHRIHDEGLPTDIPSVDGRRVILLLPARPRSEWPCDRPFRHLHAQLNNVRPLPTSEAADWLRRCGMTME